VSDDKLTRLLYRQRNYFSANVSIPLHISWCPALVTYALQTDKQHFRLPVYDNYASTLL
jgi:hypothetical protein